MCRPGSVYRKVIRWCYLGEIPGTGNHANVADVLETLSASADRIAQLLAELDDERERRNMLVVQAVDVDQRPRRDVARAARISPKSVCVFLAEYG